MRLCERLKVVRDRHSWSNRIGEGGFEFDCSGHCRDIALLGRYLVRKGRQILGAVEQLHNAHRDLPTIASTPIVATSRKR